MKTFSFEDLRARYEQRSAVVTAECRFSTELVGGVPASRDGIEAYVKHHLKLEGIDAENAVTRMMREEVGEREVPSETGELEEKLVYGLNVIRRDEFGPFLGSWMIKACLKVAASRLGIFQEKRGTKGGMAEMGECRSYGRSALNPTRAGHIYLRDSLEDKPAVTFYEELRGRIQTPNGSKSIINTVECCPAGARFAFEFRFFDAKLNDSDVADIFACAMIVGLGSAKAFDRGKFSIQQLTLDQPEKKQAEAKKPAASKRPILVEPAEEPVETAAIA